MKKSTITLLVLIILIALGGMILFSAYNGLAASREAVSTKQANIDSQLQRRADLIPNLVETVKGFAQQEKDVIDSVTSARSKLAGAQTMSDKAEANDELTSAISRLLVVVENYPTLKSDATFIGLMDELAGTENRISVARDDYNKAVQSYNTRIVTLPSSLIANMAGFEKADYFKASEGAQAPPSINFNK